MKKREEDSRDEKLNALVTEINRIHLEYSKDYFETGKVEKINLKHTFSKVPTKARFCPTVWIYMSQCDYLMKADVQDIAYVYRVKTSESILDKLRFSERQRAILWIPFLMIFLVLVWF